MSELVLPRYGASSIADLGPAIGALFGLGTPSASIRLPEPPHVVLLVVDGLGAAQLDAAGADAPFLTGLARQELTSIAPSTTAAALTSIGTGLPPGQHGIAGYTFRHPFGPGLLNALAWERGLSGLDVQPRLTLFERWANSGVAVSAAMPARFAGTGLTEAGLRGGSFLGVDDEADLDRRIEQVATAAGQGHRSFVYCYERALDHAAHEHGWRSPEWREALRRADALAAGLRAALPSDVTLLVTADHGLVDSPDDDRTLVEAVAELGAGVRLIGGEARLRQLYTPEPAAVAARWRDVLGERAWVRTRAEAIGEGWFGPVASGLAARFGDVLVAARGTHGVLTETMPGELKLVGMHGSLTAAEMLVPLLVG